MAVSTIEECTFELAEMVPHGSDRYAQFFRVDGVDLDHVVDASDVSEVADVTLIDEYERGGLFEFEVAGIFPAVRLAELGALPRDVHSTDGGGSDRRGDPAALRFGGSRRIVPRGNGADRTRLEA